MGSTRVPVSAGATAKPSPPSFILHAPPIYGSRLARRSIAFVIGASSQGYSRFATFAGSVSREMADAFLTIVELIYDVALVPSQLESLLGKLARLMNSSFVDSFQRTDDYSISSGISYGLDRTDYDEVFIGVWANRNVWGRKRPVVRAGDVVLTKEFMPDAELRRTEMYNDYLKDRGLHEGLRLDVWAGEGWIEDMSFLRPWSSGPYDAGERRLALALMPHLQRSTAVARRLREAGQLALAGLAALENLPTAMILLNYRGQVLHRNRCAAALLLSNDGLTETPLGLAGATLSITRQLMVQVDAAQRRHGHLPRSGAMQLPRPSGSAALSATIVPLGQDLVVPGRDLVGAGWANRPAVLVCIIDPQSTLKPDHARLKALFDLTPAEASLVSQLMAGHELKDIAERRGRRISTLRSQLGRVLEKTETSRQVELISLLTRLHLGPVD